MSRVKRGFSIFREAFKGWSRDDGWRLAAAVAFYGLFSLAPLLLFTLFLLGLFLGDQAAKGEVVRTLELYTSERAAAAVQNIVTEARQTEGQTLTNIIGLAVLLFAASNVFFQLKWALNRMWDVPAKRTRGVWAWIRSRLIAISMVISATIFLFLVMVISAVLAGLQQFIEVPIPGGVHVWRGLSVLVFFALLTFVFALIFKYVPDVDISWKTVWVPALVTSVLFSIGQLVLTTYMGKATVASVYGAAASLVIILIWVYFTSMVLLYGAEFAEVYSRDDPAVKRSREERLEEEERERERDGSADERSSTRREDKERREKDVGRDGRRPAH
jgi:membrane protein